MTDNGNGRQFQTITTTAAAIFNLGAIVVVCFILIPLTMTLSAKLDNMQKSIDGLEKTAKRLNEAMDTNEARSKAIKR